MSGATVAAIAAAQAKAKQNKEEEQMTAYSQNELEQNWEFKIVRSCFQSFGNQQKLNQLCKEEARAGWVMVEKFDNSRIRFKRPPEAKERDKLLTPDIDPYRTQFGMREGSFALMIIGVVFGSIFLILGLVMLIKNL